MMGIGHQCLSVNPVVQVHACPAGLGNGEALRHPVHHATQTQHHLAADVATERHRRVAELVARWAASTSGLALPVPPVMLTPASIGTEWFAEHVNRKAMVLGLSPRITFDDTPPNPKTGKVEAYPKDLMLSVFGMGLNGFDTWQWKP